MQEMSHAMTAEAAAGNLPEASGAEPRRREYFDVPLRDWGWAVAFLLSMSLAGLKFPLGHLLVILFLLRSFKLNRYEFLAQLTLFLGGFGMANSSMSWGINLLYPSLLVAFFGMAIFKNVGIVRKTSIAMVVYTLCIVGFALIAEESLKVQIRNFTPYLSISFFIIPLMIFSGEEFEFTQFINKLFPYAIILCGFYVLDCYVINGWVLLPTTFIDDSGTESTFRSLLCNPFTTWFPRKYPPGLFVLAMLVYPLSRQYKLRWWQWALIIGAFCASRTFSVLSGFIFGYIIAQGAGKKLVVYGVLSVGVLAGLYCIDDSMGLNAETKQSKMRIASSINQLIDLENVEDDEDLAAAGTGRMAQALPKIEHLYSLGMEWTGFGFIDRFNTTNQKFVIENDLYLDPEQSVEVATGIEIIPLQVFVTMGYIGLVIHTLFFAYLWWIVRKLRYSGYFLTVMLMFVWFGIGGFEGLIQVRGQLLTALAYAVVILMNKQDIKGFSLRRKTA